MLYSQNPTIEIQTRETTVEVVEKQVGSRRKWEVRPSVIGIRLFFVCLFLLVNAILQDQWQGNVSLGLYVLKQRDAT